MIRPTLPSLGALVLLGACTDSRGTPASLSSPTVVGLGLASAPGELAGADGLWLLGVREFDSGGRDLNGDGDAADRAVHVLDLATGTVRSLGLALETRGLGPVLAVGGGLGLFSVSEAASGGRDRNGDGDASDAVVYVVDGASGTSQGLEVALAPFSLPALGDGLAAFLVSEAAQGRDLDGDGVRDDEVLHVYDLARRELVNARFAPASPLFVGGGRVAFFAAESGQDLNADGDLLDRSVLQLYDPLSDTRVNTGVATLGTPPLAAGDAWLVEVPEGEQGFDLNGDADLADVVWIVVDARAFARGGGAPPGPAPFRSLALVSGGPGAALVSSGGTARFGLLASEAGSVDLNLDGDLADRVAFLYDPATEVLAPTGHAAVRIVFAGEWLGFLALESAQGSATDTATDLNGDGDVLDAVAFLLDPLTGAVSNLRQDALELVGSEEDVLVLLRPESGSESDWNEDGDRADVVAQVYDRIARTTANTRLATAAVFGATRAELLLAADEAAQARDLDGDGDRADAVFVLYDLARRRGLVSGLAGSDAFAFAALGSSGRAVLLASEPAQGRDLNGDGDRVDEVLHRAE